MADLYNKLLSSQFCPISGVHCVHCNYTNNKKDRRISKHIAKRKLNKYMMEEVLLEEQSQPETFI